jgi:hypothetical protein
MKNTYIKPNKGSVCIRLEQRNGHKWVFIDASDFSLVSSYAGYWQARWSPSANTYYAQIRIGKNPSKFIQMHRLIMDIVHEDHLKIVVDHEDHNGLNNHRWNLEKVTRAVNQGRRAGAQSNNICGLRGVTKARGRWRAATYKNRSTQTLGFFDTKEAAAVAVAKAWA